MTSPFLVAVANVLAGFECVPGAAVGALGLACAGHIQVDLGVTVPELHVRFFAGAKHAAMTVEVYCQEFNWIAHVQTFVNQCAYLGLRPLTMSKNAVWIFSVIGPRLPT